MLKKLLIAGLAAGTLSLGVVANQAPAQAGVHVNIGIGAPGWHRWHGKRCKWVAVWRHHHKTWVRRCW